MRKLFLILLIFLIISFVSAVRINEIMYNPKPITDAYNEWIELYNDENFDVDLNGWTLNGKKFNNSINIPPKGYIIIARKLLQGTSTNPDSFESVYGNGDGIWDQNDGGYLAVQLSFGSGLNNDGGTIVLKNNQGEIISSITYSKSMGANGNGKSLQYCSGNWFEEESTPGKENLCPSNEETKTSNKTTENEEDTSEVTQNNITEINQNSEIIQTSTENQNKDSKDYKPITLETIKLDTKDIKTEGDKDGKDLNKLNKSNYAIFGFIAFCILLGILFLIKNIKKSHKSEFD